MRDNGKFQDSLLKVCACAIVCGHTGFPALEPLANKPIIFRGKKNSWQWLSLFTSVWEWRWTTTKSNNEDVFFWSCFEGFAVGFAKFKYHSCHSPNVSVFFSSCLLQVNSMSVEGKTHSDVVAAIKAGGHETRLLVVDPETDSFFKRCRVTPTSEHLTGESTISCSLWGFTSCAEGVEQMSAFSCFIRHVMDTSLLLPSSQTSSTLKPRFFSSLRSFLSVFILFPRITERQRC